MLEAPDIVYLSSLFCSSSPGKTWEAIQFPQLKRVTASVMQGKSCLISFSLGKLSRLNSGDVDFSTVQFRVIIRLAYIVEKTLNNQWN